MSLRKRREQDRSLRENRRFFPHITAEMWRWFESFLGRDGLTMRLLLLAGGRHLRKLAQTFMDIERLIEAGFFVRPDPVAACAEYPLGPQGCAYWSADQRFYFNCAAEHPADRVPGVLGGKWLELYVTSAERWIKSAKIDSLFFDYGDPCDPEFRNRTCFEERVRALRNLAAEERLFHCMFGLPWGRWIGPFVRDMCGEVVVRDANGPVLLNGKRQLLKIGDARWSHGFVFGLHPLYACGGAVVAEALQGADPLERILSSHLDVYSQGNEVKSIKARLGVFGIGPSKMDDGRLFCHAGPPGKLAAWTLNHHRPPLTLADFSGDRRREEERREIFRAMVEGTKELIPRTILVKRGREGYGAADAIANQIWVLYQAHQFRNAG